MEAYTVGTRVKALRDYVGVPKGTEGVIDEIYFGGVMVAWDLPDKPLPAHYRAFDGVPSVRSGILRDGFSAIELPDLAIVSKLTEKLTE